MPPLSLSELGLSEQQSAVYLAALELGFGSISDIAKKASIKRPTAYNVIDDLMQKNLISRSPKGKRTMYVAEPPQNLLQSVRAQEDKLMNMLPQLEALRKAGPHRPRIRFYEGKEGVRTLYREMFKTHHKILAIASMERFSKIFTPEENQEFFELLRAEGGSISDLLDDSAATRAYSRHAYRKGLGSIKYLPHDFKVEVDMLIQGDKVSIISFVEMIGIIIDNSAIAQAQRQLFNFMWKHL